MKKIPTLFIRDENFRATAEVHPGCEWVLNGEGITTVKLDGTNMKIQDGQLFKRRKPKDGKEYDEASYVSCHPDEPSDCWGFEGLANLPRADDGIYELIGPKVQGNPEGRAKHQLIGVLPPDPCLFEPRAPRTFEGLREWLREKDVEGLVFHHPDGRLAKIKKKDFGMTRRRTT